MTTVAEPTRPFAPFRRAARKFGFSLLLSKPLIAVYDRLWPLSHFGDRGEREAERFLLRKGWVIVARGYEDRVGELDIVAVDGPTLVFVEVKTRSSHSKGHPAEAVDFEKQKQLSRVGLSYLKWHNLRGVPTRFDIIAITWPSGESPTIEHFLHAFEPTLDW